MSEKVYHAWVAGSVPIFMGTKTIRMFAPSPHSVIHVEDFPTIRDLANEIIRLSNDKSAYEEYLEWKHRGVDAHFLRVLKATSSVHPMCKVCHYVKDMIMRELVDDAAQS